MRPQSTTTDLPSTYDVGVHLHNKFVKHIEELKDAISVSEAFFLKDGKELTGYIGSSRESFHYCRWMVSRYNKDGISWDDSTLDQGDRRKVEVESRGDWFQGLIRHSQWGEFGKICCGIAGPCGYHGYKTIKGMTLQLHFV
jgi:hypothetical protein